MSYKRWFVCENRGEILAGGGRMAEWCPIVAFLVSNDSIQCALAYFQVVGGVGGD